MLHQHRMSTALIAITHTNIKNCHEGPTFPLPRVDYVIPFGSNIGCCSLRSIRTIKAFLVRCRDHDIDLLLVRMLMLKCCIHINGPSDSIIPLTPIVYHHSMACSCEARVKHIETSPLGSQLLDTNLQHSWKDEQN
jgi:hypothetical protein